MRSGIVLLDKPLGLTSNAALQRVRALRARQKAGYVGSLDPLATGMLPICLGEATKIAGEILAGRKRYRFSVALGVQTATGDAAGEIVASAPVPALESDAVTAVLARFRGPQRQVPPMYSALKRGGQPLYKLARAGLTVTRAPRDIELFELTLCSLAPESLELEALCSKGTYIRALAEDVTAALGTCGHVASLRRLYVEPFQEERMYTLEELAADSAHESPPVLLAIDRPLGHLNAVHLERAAAQRVLSGQSITLAAAAQPGAAAPVRIRLYDESGRFLGLGEADALGAVRPRRLLSLRDDQ